MDTTVNFEIAKLVKKEGYDNVTDLIYMTNHSKEVLFENINGLKHSDGNNPFCSAPTIAEVVMWLYEKHGIWISVDIGMTGFYGHYKVNPQNTLPSNLKQGWANDQDNPAKSITEAYEAAIDYTLENLM